MAKRRKSKTIIWTWLALVCLVVFTVGMLKNLGNIAFWQDEGITVTGGKTILQYGYPTVFDGRSFLLLETFDNYYHPETYFKLSSPLLQHYVAGLGLWLNGGIADTFRVRLPFALVTIVGVWGSYLAFRQLKYSRFSLFLYSALLASSVQLYLSWRQARHYALHYPLGLGLLISYLNLDKRLGRVLFLIFGFLFFHAFYPGFIGFYVAISLHALIRKLTDRNYRLRPLMILTLILLTVHVPAFVYLEYYSRRSREGFIHTNLAYLMDLNYFGYLKAVVLAAAIIVIIRCRQGFSSLFKALPGLFRSHYYSLSLFVMAIFLFPLTISSGMRNARFITAAYPLSFLAVGVSWEKMVTLLAERLRLTRNQGLIFSLPFLLLLIMFSHPRFLEQIKLFYQELNGSYYGPVTGIVNTITGVKKPQRIQARSSLRPELLIATSFENLAIYAHTNSQFLSFFAPTEEYRTGTRLPDWVIPRKQSGWETQKDYLESFLKRGQYQKVVTDYCDLEYENVYSVRTHHFRTVTDCPDTKLTLYKLKK